MNLQIFDRYIYDYCTHKYINTTGRIIGDVTLSISNRSFFKGRFFRLQALFGWQP
jgi:hypothetical protein